MDPKKIFISHIHEEVDLAIVLKDWIESTFSGQYDVFVSSDTNDLPAGSKWMDELEKSLDEAVAFIVLCSPNSLSHPWINFETGCGWIKNVPIIPICHSELTKSKLPLPLSKLQALDLTEEAIIEKLFASLTKHLGLQKMPRIDEKTMKNELMEALGKIVTYDENILPGDEKKSHDLTDEMLEILIYLSKLPTDYSVTSQELSMQFNKREQRVNFFLGKLLERNLIGASYDMYGSVKYYISQQGREYLFDMDLL